MFVTLVQPQRLLGAVENAATTKNEKATNQNPARRGTRGSVRTDAAQTSFARPAVALGL